MTARAQGPELRADPDLCAREPIHMPGSIQPHGCLVAFDPQSLAVLQVSSNVEDFLGLPVADLLHRRILDSLSQAAGESLCQALSDPSRDRTFPLTVNGRQLEGSLHQHDGVAILEIEAATAPPDLPQQPALGDTMRQISAVEILPALFQATAQLVREMSGFDRVLVYRFDDDGHGEVLAESRTDDIESYLGLHFPESDIPRQARSLYLRNWIRTVPDARYEPVPLVAELARPSAGPDRPLDLSYAALRSLSPIHLQYMANMGLQASMSMSLIVGGRLWGLVSCGHRLPRRLPSSLRRECETLARVVSLQIGAMQALDLQREQASKSDAMQHLGAALRQSGTHGLAGLPSRPDLLLHVTLSGGAAVVAGETVACMGSCPDAATVLSLSHWMAERADPRGLFATRQLSIDDARWSACAGIASGVLAIVLPTPLHSCVLWFRPEMVHTLDWGGNPHKPFDPDQPATDAVLHPRRSFELWQQEVTGRSSQWGVAEVHAALELRRSAIEIDLYRQIEREQAAVRARDDLVAVVAHDLRTPMSVVVLQSAIIQRLLAQDSSERGQRLRTSARVVQRAGERMSSLLNDLLDLARIEAGRFEISPGHESAGRIIRDAHELLEPLCDAKQLALVTHPPSGLPIRADPERLFQVLSNLIGNAVKFSPEGGTIHLGATRTPDDLCEFFVSDPGTGIAPDQLSRIFDRYWQERPEQAGGAGLGLYISRGIVEAHGGTIRAESTPGRGTTMFFTVPLDREPGAESGLDEDMEPDPEPKGHVVTAADCTIRTLRRDEVAVAVEFAAAEGWNPGLHDASCFHAADPDGFLVAEHRGQAVGCIAAVSYGERFGFIGLFVVAPPWRGQAVGHRLWEAGAARLAGRVVGLDGVPSQQDYYRRKGFVLAWQNARFAGSARPGAGPDRAGIVPLEAVDFAALCADDRRVFPAPRESFLRCWTTMRDATGLACLEQGRLAGWGVVRRCLSGYKIGPLVADRPDIADALYDALCGRVPAGDDIYLDVPLPNPQACALAAARGMRSVFETARMYAGPAPAVELDRVYGITSFELG